MGNGCDLRVSIENRGPWFNSHCAYPLEYSPTSLDLLILIRREGSGVARMILLENRNESAGNAKRTRRVNQTLKKSIDRSIASYPKRNGKQERKRQARRTRESSS